MKYFAKAIMLFAMLTCLYSSKAQNTTPRPNLFDAFSNTINCSTSELERVFTIAEGNAVQLSFGNFVFQGTVSASVNRYANLKNVLIRSSNFNGALFSISKRINDDNSVIYVGRIIHSQYADGYQLKIDASGNYFLNKIKLDDLIQDRE